MPLDDYMKETYAERVAGFETQDPGYADRWKKLENMLIAYGGLAAVPHFAPEEHLDALIENLETTTGPANRELRGEPGQCHSESSRAWIRGEITTLVTGYALNSDLWRQHTWGRDDAGEVEPTVAREAYAGIDLTDEEALIFAMANLGKDEIEEELADPRVEARILPLIKAIANKHTLNTTRQKPTQEKIIRPL